MRGLILGAGVLALAGCATMATTPAVPSAPTAEVPAAAETAAVETADADAADDPAIWARADARAFTFADKQVAGVILGTDKKAGLNVYALDGTQLQFVPDGLLNNVDLRSEGGGFLVGASDRGRMGVALYNFAGSGELIPAGFIKSDVGEPYGFCMGRPGGALIAVLVAKDGEVRVYRLSAAGDSWTGTETHRFAVGSQSEGCVVDDETGTLYIGEENVGVWAYPLDAAPGTRRAVAKVGDGRLVADVEGVTLIRDGADTFLIVSSQGDSAFAAWRLEGEAASYAGRVRIAAANGVDGVSGTDGVDAFSGAIGPYAKGLVVVQDDDNEGAAQNFKLVDWAAMRAALER